MAVDCGSAGKGADGDESWLVVDPAECEPSLMSAAVEAARAPSSLRAEFVVERLQVPLEPCQLDAVLSVIAPAAAEGQRAPLHLVAVLDKSGSMSGNKLDLVVRTMRFMLRHLSDRDALGLVAYDSIVTVLAPLTACDAHGRQLLEAALDRLKPGSTTNLSGGLLRGLELHGDGLRRVGPARPMQRARFGNTYRRVTAAEAEARKRETGAERRRPPEAQRVHEWTMELWLDEADAVLVRSVVYKLRRETFPEATAPVFEPPYRLTRLGWGRFTVHADVNLHDGRVLTLEHDLSFDAEESFHWVLLPLSAEPPAVPVATEQQLGDLDQALVRSAFLFTDGLANCGITEAGSLREATSAALEALGEKRCSVSTFGFGSDHCADLLQGLAEVGRGVYCYVDSEEKIAEAFGEALGGLLSTTHQNVRLCLELEPGVLLAGCHTAHPVRGPEERAGSGGQWAEVDLGDLFAEEQRDVLVTLSLGGAEAPGAQSLGRLSVKGFSVNALRPEEPAALALGLERCAAGRSGPPEPRVERQRQRQLVVTALEAARAAAGKGSFDEAKARLRAACDSLAASALAEQGDAVTAELLRDLQECLAGMRSQADYRDKGSKIMSTKQRAHEQQRSCGIEDTLTYTTNATMTYRMAFKEGVQVDW